MVQEVLSYENFEVMPISEACHFMVVAREFSPDLVLLDLKLRDGNGGDLCRTFKSEPAFATVPVIIFSAYINPDPGFREYGNEAVIAKPFNLTELIDTVNRVISKSQRSL